MNDNQQLSTVTEIFGFTKALAEEIRDRADETGQPFLELAERVWHLIILYETQNIETGKLITLSQQLKALEPTSRATDVGWVVHEFLNGDARSLVTYFDALDKGVIEDIVKSSITAADRLDKLQGYLNDLGFSIDILKQFEDQSQASI